MSTTAADVSPATSIDPTSGYRAVEARLARTGDPRKRALLEVLRDHLYAECTKDFPLLLSTLSDDPDYRFWIDGAGFGAGPKGLGQVTSHYENLYAENRHVCDYRIERIVVDDEEPIIVTEGWFDQVFPGGVLVARGADIDDPDAVYVLRMRLLLLWPFGPDGKLIGEDSYSNGAMYAPGNIR
ncbi:MAG: hypothetical protein IT196_27725, partial [Acidimicrobiales bacterium]|nr:hypothetical protein [Acidimicrobiales bacterium]